MTLEGVMGVEGSTKAFVFEAYLERASWRPPSKKKAKLVVVMDNF